MKARILLSFLIFSLALSSCLKDEVDEQVFNYTDEEFATLRTKLNIPVELHDYTLNLPQHLGSLTIQTNNHQATLGRVLFYDKRLSANDKVSCASCHKPDKAFSDDVAFSKGFQDEVTERNSLALGAFPSFNAYYGFGGTRMFWDERASDVREQSHLTLENPIEMGMKLNELADKLMQEDYYQILFRKAFPSNDYYQPPVEEQILLALQAFVNSIGCYETQYDQQMEGRFSDEENFANFTAQENYGKQLFNQNCASCHNLSAGFSTTITSANNGLDEEYTDDGIGEVTHQNKDVGVFKVPMLRNVALTAPYMHDGRFETLEEVVEHYNSGVKNHENLHENLINPQTGEPKKLNLNAEEKASLVAFLHTLTDANSLLVEKYADPFK